MHSSILQWLSSGELLNAATTSMSELLEVTDQVKGKDKGEESGVYIENHLVLKQKHRHFSKI